MKMTIIGEHMKDWDFVEIIEFPVRFAYAIFKIALGEKFCCHFLDHESPKLKYNYAKIVSSTV